MISHAQNSARGIALVTGGAGAIGAACCRQLAEAGFRIGVVDIQEERAKELAAELPDSFALKVDLSSDTDVEAVYAHCKSADVPLAVLVNNAGLTIDAPLFRAKLDDFDKVVAVNMRGSWYLTKRLSRLMMRHRSGRIIFISSVVGSIGNPSQSVYGMTKAGLDNLARTLAFEMAPYGILVNAIAPGFIESPMTAVLAEDIKSQILSSIPLNRIGIPDEIAEVVTFLATRGSYITGTTLHVNGGLYGG